MMIGVRTASKKQGKPGNEEFQTVSTTVTVSSTSGSTTGFRGESQIDLKTASSDADVVDLP